MLCIFPPPVVLWPNAGHGLIMFEVPSCQYDSSGRVFSLLQRPLPDNTQHSQETDIHALGGIRTHNLNRRAAKDLRLRPRGHWYQLFFYHIYVYMK